MYYRILCTMRNVLEKFVDKIKTHFMFNCYFSENRAVNKTMWNNVARQDTDDNIMWCMES